MSLSLAIALNVVLDAGLLGLLAYAMSRPARLDARQADVIQLPVAARGERSERAA